MKIVYVQLGWLAFLLYQNQLASLTFQNVLLFSFWIMLHLFTLLFIYPFFKILDYFQEFLYACSTFHVGYFLINLSVLRPESKLNIDDEMGYLGLFFTFDGMLKYLSLTFRFTIYFERGV